MTTAQPNISGFLTGLQNTNDDAAVTKQARLSTGTAATAADSVLSDEEIDAYWEDEDWVPQTKSGKQRTPNMIRNELQKYIDNSSQTQTFIVENKLHVNYNSFRKFMNPKTYKDQWSAIQNGTYWAAARLLEEERNKPKKTAAKTANKKKRPREDEGGNEAAAASAQTKGAKKSKKGAKAEAVQLMQKILNVEGIEETTVYDSCPQLVKKIKTFLAQDGVTKKDFCDLALGGVNSNALAKFLSSKKQDQAGNAVYYKAYGFFEKKRIMEGEAKSAARRKNEKDQPEGFALRAPKTMKWVYCVPGEVIPGFY